MGYFGRPDGPIPEVTIVTFCPTCGKSNPKRWSSSGPDDETVKHVSRVCVVCRATAELPPGSTKAVAQGCTCPSFKSVDGTVPVVIRLNCPVHIKPSRKEK